MDHITAEYQRVHNLPLAMAGKTDNCGAHILPQTPTRPPKRPLAITPPKIDAAKTPRPPLQEILPTLSQASEPEPSVADSTDSPTTSRTGRSGRSSPRKRELALRRTTDYPVQRVDLAGLAAVAQIASLVRTLKQIRRAKKGLIPDIFKTSLLL